MISRVATATLLRAGIAGPVLFVAVLYAEDVTRPGFDAVRQYVSLLSLGDLGWIQVANFIAGGMLIAAFGLGLRRSSTDRTGRWMAWLVVLAGVALAWSGIFTADPAQGYPDGAPAGLPRILTWHANLHVVGGIVVFASLAAAGVLSAIRRTGRGAAASTGWAVYSLLGAAIVLGGWIAGFVIVGPNGFGPAAGLVQRITVVAGMQWLAVTALLELRRDPAPALASADRAAAPAEARAPASSPRAP